MKLSTLIPALALACAVGLAATDADARRFGGGGSFGKQRAAPTMREAPKPTPAQNPQAQPGQAAPANAAVPAGAGAAGAAAKGGFMGRWGGMLAGLGIGALLATMFGEQLGPIIGMLLMVMLVAGIALLLMRVLGGRRAAPAGGMGTIPGQGGRRAAFSGIGSRLSGGTAMPDSVSSPHDGPIPAGFDTASFERVAKTSFIRLQAANDARDLDDIRDYTTPEMFAEIAMQVKERGDAPQRTEVVSLESKVIEVAQEDGYEIASVRFWGLLREAEGEGPQPFDETWHVQKKLGDRRATWLIAGIQQND